MAGLPYFAFAWLVAIMAVAGVIGTILVTDTPGDADTSSQTTALATALFIVAVTASMTL